MNTLPTAFDSYTYATSKLLQQALNDGGRFDIPDKYIDNFREMVVLFIWRRIPSAIVSFELYGDARKFEFNLGGYIDTYYENDNIRWHGFSEKQAAKLGRCYPEVVQAFRNVALDIIETHLRHVVTSDIEPVSKFLLDRTHRTFRNMEYIAWECRNGKLTAEEIYDIFLEQGKALMHYNENKK
jgi:hypothetical protein